MPQDPLTFIHWLQIPFLERLYSAYQDDPTSVDPSWGNFFSGMQFAKDREVPLEGSERFLRLMEAYRKKGYTKIIYDPLQEPSKETLSISDFGFLEKDLTSCQFLGKELQEWIALLEKSYHHHIGIEMECISEEMALWIQERMEHRDGVHQLEELRKIWEGLYQTEIFEKFIHTKYVGQTRFSLEGGETLIPALQHLLVCAQKQGIEEIFFGMAHRGRLDVLTQVLRKSYADIFAEFEETPSVEGSGDVKYHKGAHANLLLDGIYPMSLVLPSNASHLESVDPIIEGQVLAKQQLKQDKAQDKVIAVLIHGDASLSGQGVVYETMQLGQLPGYKTGGTLHIVINNHIGYTTLPSEGRSTIYCTDIAKAFGAPVLHVSAEHPEECMEAIAIALALRMQFHTDVFIDLHCYRKYGHNEGDEPGFTQPLEYLAIREKKSICSMFEEKWIERGFFIAKEVEQERKRFFEHLQEVYANVPKGGEVETPQEQKKLKEEKFPISLEKLQMIGRKITAIAPSFSLHRKLEKIQSQRRLMIENPSTAMVDFAMAEALAFGSLLLEGITVRLSGQDVQRGTFSHRHAVWVDQKNGERYTPLSHMEEAKAPFFIYNSPLSEFAVMGFDLGYSLAHPRSLVLWEAQYGDFCNEAQVIIDQYIASGEQKWSHRLNFTLLLPHGYEGRGPEHSSARIERFLSLCAENNLYVVNCTLPSQYFHLLRRQGLRAEKKPLVIFTPKRLLREPSCVSSMEQLSLGEFTPCLADDLCADSAKTLILCSGKIFFELEAQRKLLNREDVAIVRIEQLYPFPAQELHNALEKYTSLRGMLWVQEEPKNMGPWYYIERMWHTHFPALLPLEYVGRKESASVACGSYAVYEVEQKQLIQAAFT